MYVIKTDIKQIDKIFHIADVHIRNVKRHKEYKIVFKRLYSYIKKNATPNSVIYVAGDIVHAKTDMSPELIDMVSDFFRSLADISPTIVITGNHDCNLNNSDRLDALYPIVKAIKHTDLHYLKDTGIYRLADVDFNVMSVFDKPIDFIKADKLTAETKIALHHGAVNNASTDAGFVLQNDHVTTTIFDGHDMTLLGDIHKTQYLDNDKTIAYAGSLIQQNHGEGLVHGILVWDVNTRTSEFVEIKNDYGYYTAYVEDGELKTDISNIPLRPRLRLKVKNTDAADIKAVTSYIRSKCKVQDITIQRVNEINTTNTANKINFGSVRDVEWQNNVISEYLTADHGVDDKMMDIVRYINRTVHSKLVLDKQARNTTWVPKRFEFSNMFSYGTDNVIDFGSLQGSYGLFAPNASGKSTLLDALAFCCFDKCSRTKKAAHVLNNKCSNFQSKFEFELGKHTYCVERSGKKQSNDHVKVTVNFYRYDANGNEENLNGDQRDSTNKNIRDYLGTYEDFVLTALSLQNNNTGFIDKTQRERKDLLSQFLDIEIFEQQYLIGHEDIKETAALIREYKKKDLSKDLSDAELDSETYQKISDKISKDKADHNEMRRNLNEIIITLSQQLYEIHDLENPEDIKEKIRVADLELENNDKQITEYSGFISKANEKLEDIDKQLSEIDKSNLQQLINLHEQRRIELSDMEYNQMSLKKEIEHAQRMTSKLDDHKWNPDCEYCMANPWLHETKTIAEKLPELQNRLGIINNQVKLVQDNLKKIDIDNVKNKLSEYDNLEDKKRKIRDNVYNVNTSLDQCERQNYDLKSEINSLNESLNKSLQQIEYIEHNQKLNNDINEHKNELTFIEREINDIDQQLIDVSGKLSVANQKIADTKADIQRLKDLEKQYQGYEYYMKAVKRDGVPYYLISKALPKIEAEINNILTQIVDFTILLQTDGKNINAFIVYDEDNYWPLELTSGMEKFVSSLAIRTSLINVSNLPRPNFLAIDEGFGVLDSDNLNSMYMLFDYLKTQFGFIMCISHIDAMRDIVDKLIEIKKTGGYSKIQYL
jgi:DNA repair exonuclease SbcCD ATPase subunit